MAAAKAQRAMKHKDAVVTALAQVREKEFSGTQITMKQKVSPALLAGAATGYSLLLSVCCSKLGS